MTSTARNLAIVCVVATVVGLSGCSNPKMNDKPQGYLATHIFEDGSKQFVYSVDLPESGRGGKGGKGGGRPGNASGQINGGSNGGLTGGVSVSSNNRQPSGRGGGRPNSKDAMLVSLLDDELKVTGFCRDGFKEMDRSLVSQQTFLKGECNEVASANDRENFPNESE